MACPCLLPDAAARSSPRRAARRGRQRHRPPGPAASGGLCFEDTERGADGGASLGAEWCESGAWTPRATGHAVPRLSDRCPGTWNTPTALWFCDLRVPRRAEAPRARLAGGEGCCSRLLGNNVAASAKRHVNHGQSTPTPGTPACPQHGALWRLSAAPDVRPSL